MPELVSSLIVALVGVTVAYREMSGRPPWQFSRLEWFVSLGLAVVLVLPLSAILVFAEFIAWGGDYYGPALPTWWQAMAHFTVAGFALGAWVGILVSMAKAHEGRTRFQAAKDILAMALGTSALCTIWFLISYALGVIFRTGMHRI